MPLLHTWSLAIEEQYYLFAPVVSLALWRFGKLKFTALVAVMGLSSLLFCVWSSRNAPEFNFYFTLTRVWELLAGALCGLSLLDRPVRQNDWLSAVGLGAILLSVFWLDTATPLSFGCIPCCRFVARRCIILFAGADTRIGRLLSHPLAVGVGLISYSTYLWHQPLLAFARGCAVSTRPRKV